MLDSAVRLKDGHVQCRVTIRETGTVRGTARRPHFSLAIISVTVQLRIYVGVWVISMYFNVRNILPKSVTFPPGHPVYIYIYTYFFLHMVVSGRNM